tara:strand:+ start:44 stop:328 length:285 start_codon:yes stop_codon:yes gene_type:complete
MNKKSVIVWEDGTITYKDELGNIRTSSVDDVKMEISNILNRSGKYFNNTFTTESFYKKLDKLLVGNGLMEEEEYSNLCSGIEEFIIKQIKTEKL